MRLSWSHKLFLWVNQRVGNYPALDKFMYFCAQWLVFIFAGVLFPWLFLQERLFLIIFLAPTFLLAYLLSYGIGYLWRHERPEREFPMIKTLITPLQSWKSFPSDHAIFVTLSLLSAIFLSAPASLIFCTSALAILVVIARVYVGIHYPRDILGGIIIACVSFFFVAHIISQNVSFLVP